jgi:D-galactarolactone cycloisomerase
MPVLKGKNILASPHNWGLMVKTFYTVQFVGAFGNTASIEGVTCTSDDVDLTGYKLVNGRYIHSELPGFGMKLLKKSV